MTDLFEIPGVYLPAVLPEAIVAIGGLVLLLMGSGRTRANPKVLIAAVLIFLGVGIVATSLASGPDRLAFDGTVARDGFATFLKLVFLVAASLSALASLHFIDDEDEVPVGEFGGLMLFATAGMMLMASAADLIVVFLALETFSLALYVLAAIRRRRLDSQEGALKYFLTGSFASAFFLYGVALVYGGTGSTRLEVIVSHLKGSVGIEPLVLGGVSLLVVGLAFKVAAVPFHMWTPDVYEGAPAPVTGFMAAGSKAAGFAVLIRVLVATFPTIQSQWRPVLSVIAVITMVTGSLIAVAQSNVKRMLAYSAIAHSGFLLIGVVAANDRGISGSLFYLAIYSVVIVAAFVVVYLVAGSGERHQTLSSFRGLGVQRPLPSAVFALLLISLAGVPPTGGFWAKFEVFSAGIESGLTLLVVVGVLTSAIAAFFYIRLIVLMYLEDAPEWQTKPKATPAVGGLVLLAVAAIVIVMGIFPTPLIDFARDSQLVLR